MPKDIVVDTKSNFYPIVPTDKEKKVLGEWLRVIREENETNARETWHWFYELMSSPSRTRVPKSKFGWGSEKMVFDPLMDYIIEAVLLVAVRFNWQPEEILALWQIEGLCCTTGFHPPKCAKHKNLEPEGWSKLLPIKANMGKYGREPRDREEAKSYARSIILYERWGLDILVKTVQQVKDTVISGEPGTKHDEQFRTGFAQKIAQNIPQSPLEYLKSDDGPIRVGNARGYYEYRTHSEYQTTMLAMQFAQFKYLESIIQKGYGEMKVRRARIELKPPFPALVRTFYNCGLRENRKTLIRAIKDLVEQNLKRRKIPLKQEKYTSYDLNDLFRVMPIPDRLLPSLRQYRGPGRCYIGGLRFELLRLTYKDLFAHTL